MSTQSIVLPIDSSEVVYKELSHLHGYRIGSDGSVWSERGRHRVYTGVWKRLKGGHLPRGHLYVNLVTKEHKRGWPHLIHRLVLEAFVGPCPPGMQACHDPDRNPSNNRLENLRWDTSRANSADSIRHGTMPHGSDKWAAKLHESDIPVIRALRRMGWANLRIANAFLVSFEAIRRITAGKAWKHVPDISDAVEAAVFGNGSCNGQAENPSLSRES